MLSCKDLDAVSICIPIFLHAQISIAALEADKHVLCEKPLAMNTIEAEKSLS
jgi:predicted dehydrogenase